MSGDVEQVAGYPASDEGGVPTEDAHDVVILRGFRVRGDVSVEGVLKGESWVPEDGL